MSKSESEPRKVFLRVSVDMLTLAAVITAVDYFTDGDLDIYNGIRYLGNQVIGYLTQ